MIMVWQVEKLRDYLTSLHVATDSEELFVLVLGDNLLRHYFIFFLLLEISFYLYFRFSGPKRSWRCHPKGFLLRKIRNNLRKLTTMDINFISTASNCTQTQLFIKMTRCEGAGVLKQKRKTTQLYVRWTPILLAPSGALIAIPTYYWPSSTTTPLFQITPVLNTGLSLSEPLQLYKGYIAI